MKVLKEEMNVGGFVMYLIQECNCVETLTALNAYVHEWHVKAYPNIFRDSTEKDFEEYFQKTIDNPNCHNYVAYDDTKAIGLIQAEIRTIQGNVMCLPNKLVFVHIMVVHPGYQRKGVGRLLMNKVYELAAENRISRIELDHWERNNSASSFFGELGFKPFRHYLFIERN